MSQGRSERFEHWQAIIMLATLVILLTASVFALAVALLILPAAAAFFAILHLEQGVKRTPPRPDWLSRSVLSGFVAGAIMLAALVVAFVAANLIATALTGDHNAVSRVQVAAWFFNLAHNVVTDLAQRSLYLSAGVHFAFGILFAMVYGRYVEPRLGGPHWVRGLTYALIPWVLSVTVFFPLAGAGWFGIALGAGPLPFLGNLLLHAVYGSALGVLYGPLGDRLPGDEWEADDVEEVADLQHAEATAAKGIGFGAAAGLVLGAIIALLLPDLSAAPVEADIIGLALLGGALGALVGSLFGLPTGATRYAH